MTPEAISAVTIGLMTALGLVMRATPQVFAAIAKAIDAHSSLYTGLQRRLDECEARHDREEKRITHLEAQARADFDANARLIDALDEAVAKIDAAERRATSLSRELTALAASIASAEHHATTHRGAPP